MLANISINNYYHSFSMFQNDKIVNSTFKNMKRIIEVEVKLCK